MRRTERLAYERSYGSPADPLCSPILPDEVPSLMSRLRARLKAGADVLDQSLESLNQLERLLLDYHNTEIKTQFSEDDMLSLVREIAAYIGNVLVIDAGAEWSQAGLNLWSTMVSIEGLWEVTKGGSTYSSDLPTSYVLGHLAARTCDDILEGKRPHLYKFFRPIKSRRLWEPGP